METINKQLVAFAGAVFLCCLVLSVDCKPARFVSFAFADDGSMVAGGESVVDPAGGESQQSSTSTRHPLCAIPLLYRPVCGSDGETYANQFALACKKVEIPDLVKVSDGQCGGGTAIPAGISAMAPLLRQPTPISVDEDVSHEARLAADERTIAASDNTDDTIMSSSE